MAEGTPPDSPHVRSGVSSFSHISSPASYQFSRDGDASDEEGSNWSSDEVSTPCTSPILHDNSATGAHYTTDSNTRSAKIQVEICGACARRDAWQIASCCISFQA